MASGLTLDGVPAFSRSAPTRQFLPGRRCRAANFAGQLLPGDPVRPAALQRFGYQEFGSFLRLRELPKGQRGAAARMARPHGRQCGASRQSRHWAAARPARNRKLLRRIGLPKGRG
jgi:hypothetical protein